MASDHIVKAYSDELDRLTSLISEMGGLAERAVGGAVQALVRRDAELAQRLIEADKRIDALDREVSAFVVRLLALRQPMANDLRTIVSSLKIASDIERIGDYAKNIAKRSLILNQMAPIDAVAGVPRLSRLTEFMLHDVLDAFVQRDVAKAISVRDRDEEVDGVYTAQFRELLTYMIEDPRTITACAHLAFISKNVERIGDHTTNIAEEVVYLVTGEALAERQTGATPVDC